MRQRRRGESKTSGPAGEAGKGGSGAGGTGRRPEPLVTATSARAKTRATVEAPLNKKRSRASRHPLVVGLNFVLFVGMVTFIGAIAALVIGRQAYLAPGPLAEDVQVNIPRGASVQSIAQGLEEQDIISSQYVFLAAAYGSGATRSMKAGEYVIPANASISDVLQKIVSGQVVQHQITFAEGLTSAQIVKRLNDNEILSGIIRQIPPEGSLMPETYSITRGMPRERLLEQMQTAQAAALAEIWEARDPEIPVSSPEELVTLASIVEKETGRADERARVAAVFANRLKRRMKLQSDPTILYGLYGGEAWEEARTIYQSDLNRPNPYNTYQINGLPPGPIANPGREAMEATANPDETNELYFVADGTGGHAFATSYEAHQANVARWREIERQRNAETTQ